MKGHSCQSAFIKKRWSIIPPISIKQTITSHLKSLTMTYETENAFVFFLNKGLTSQTVFVILGNKRLQEMMEIMAKERGATLFATDERFKTFFKLLIFGVILFIR